MFYFTCDRSSRYTKMQISRKRLEIEVRYQLITDRKWLMSNRMHTWPITSRDLERSRSWPNYVWGLISRKRLEIHTWSQWGPIGKGVCGIEWLHGWWRHVIPKRSRAWPNYVWRVIYRKRLEIHTWSQWSTNRKWSIGSRDPFIGKCKYLKNGERYRLGTNWPQIGKGIWRIECTRDRWRHMT